MKNWSKIENKKETRKQKPWCHGMNLLVSQHVKLCADKDEISKDSMPRHDKLVQK